MSTDSDWITAAIAKARQKGAVGPDIVWSRVEGLLRGSFRERPLPAMQLESVARNLIEAMVPEAPSVRERGED
jgi:hypothetical protein